MPKTIKGRCLCGKVRFEVSEPFDNFYFCHCGRCRKATGSAHSANIFVSLSSLIHLSGAPSMSPINNIFWEDRACWYEQGIQAIRCKG